MSNEERSGISPRVDRSFWGLIQTSAVRLPALERLEEALAIGMGHVAAHAWTGSYTSESMMPSGSLAPLPRFWGFEIFFRDLAVF